jgi:hypothetical protein
MEPILLVALSNAVAELPAVVEALSKDPAVLSLTVTAVLLLIKSIIMNYETISTVSDNITVLVEAQTTIGDLSLTTYKATRTLRVC